MARKYHQFPLTQNIISNYCIKYEHSCSISDLGDIGLVNLILPQEKKLVKAGVITSKEIDEIDLSQMPYPRSKYDEDKFSEIFLPDDKTLLLLMRASIGSGEGKPFYLEMD